MKPKGTKNKEIRGRTITYPTPGFQNDVVRLLQKFVATKSIRFEEFLKVWRESNFSLVHLGRNLLRESREFLEECFKILLKYIMPPYNLQVRVGGLYLIYGMFYTQHIRMKPRKVRIPLSCWPSFCELRQEVTEHQHLDAVYIIRKLISDRAFMMCAYPTHLSVDEVYLLEDGRETTAVTYLDRSSGLGEAVGLLTQIQDEDKLGQLRAVHEKYHQLKCEFNVSRGGSADSPGSSLDLIKPDITNTVLDIINPPKNDDLTALIKRTETKSDDTSSDRALRIKTLKESAASSKVKSALQSPSNKNSDVEEWVVKKKGRPHQSPTNFKPRKTVFSSTTEESSEADSNADSNERKRPRKSEPKKIVPYHTDDDYEPDEPVTVPSNGSRPTRRKRSSQSTDDNKNSSAEKQIPTKKSLRLSNQGAKRRSVEDVAVSQKQTPTKKSPHSSTKGTAAIDQNEVQPGTFVGIRSPRQNRCTPVIGKVITTDKPDIIEVVHYNGDFDTAWKPITAIRKDDLEGKPLVQPVKRINIILTNVILTKTGRLVASSKTALKKAMKLA